jgi:hypothetical protein
VTLQEHIKLRNAFSKQSLAELYQKPLPIPVGVVMAAEVGDMTKPRVIILGGRHDNCYYNWYCV